MTNVLSQPDVLTAAPLSPDASLSPEQSALAHEIHQRLIQETDIAALEKQAPEKARAVLVATVRALVASMASGLYGEAKEMLVKAVLDEAVGLGPIQSLVDDRTISEVMVNAPDEVYFERDGIIYLSSTRFRDNGHVMRIVERIIAPLGRRIDESSPYVDARLPNCSRGNVIIPAPVPPMAPPPPNIEVKHEVTQRDLVRNSLRMRPDRIIVGEVRGPEAFDMMQAMNTGHEGS